MKLEEVGSVAVGSLVRLGPAYRMGGYYEPDGNEGIYTVVGELSRGDFYLVKGHAPEAAMFDFDLICKYTRLSLVGSPITAKAA